MSVTRDRSRDEARRDWLHVSGMPRIRGVALDSAPSSPPRGYRFLLHLLATTIVLWSTTFGFIQWHQWRRYLHQIRSLRDCYALPCSTRFQGRIGKKGGEQEKLWAICAVRGDGKKRSEACQCFSLWSFLSFFFFFFLVGGEWELSRVELKRVKLKND